MCTRIAPPSTRGGHGTRVCFLRAAVPLSKVDLFRSLLEETAFHLTNRRHFMDYLPLILQQEQANIRLQFGDVRPFLDENEDFGPATQQKLLGILNKCTPQNSYFRLWQAHLSRLPILWRGWPLALECYEIRISGSYSCGTQV